MIKKSLEFIFLMIFILLTKPVSGQFVYGVQLQSFGGAKRGAVIADSITVVNDSRASLKFEVPQTIGLFLEYKLKGNLPFTFRSEISYKPHPIGLGLSIFNSKFFAGKPIGVYTYKSYNFAFELPFNLCYNLIQKERFPFLKLRNLEIGLLGGVTIQLLSRGERETYPIAKNFNSPGISDVNFAIYNTIRNINYFYNYGARVRLGHFIATYRRDLLLTKSGTNDLKVWGNSYSFRTSYNYESISLGYTFSFKKHQ